ncbi:hypothetical protein [Maridesulfovibrio sp.]|uniref:hypothetical protein n=1 Tax=unclassified Maridesulfovibrio TaxID=2794999 RepID=UPI003B00EA11
MRISSFGLNQAGQVGDFKLAEFKKETPSGAEEIKATPTKQGPQKMSQKKTENI